MLAIIEMHYKLIASSVSQTMKGLLFASWASQAILGSCLPVERHMPYWALVCQLNITGHIGPLVSYFQIVPKMLNSKFFNFVWNLLTTGFPSVLSYCCYSIQKQSISLTFHAKFNQLIHQCPDFKFFIFCSSFLCFQ